MPPPGNVIAVSLQSYNTKATIAYTLFKKPTQSIWFGARFVVDAINLENRERGASSLPSRL